MTTRRFGCTVVLFALLAIPAAAQTAGMLSFQGLIKDAGGVPVTGSIDLEFRIYDAETLGNLVDMDGDGVIEDVIGEDAKLVLGVTATNGILSTKFGPVSPKAFDGNPRWLELSVDGSPLSRIEMPTAPAAAEQVNIPFTGAPAISVDDVTGNVGIGTTSPPTNDLQVAGGITTEDLITKGPWTDVRAFGAKGDGTTDDRVAIQQALDSGRAHIVIPPGIYRLDPNPQYPGADLLTVPSTVKLIQGPGTLCQGGPGTLCQGGPDTPPTGGEPNIMKVQDSERLTIHNVTFLGNMGPTAPSNNNGIVAEGCLNLTVANCTFRGLVNQAIYVTGTPTKVSEHIKIVDNSCLDIGSGITLTKCRFATIRGNIIRSSPIMTEFRSGIQLTSTAVIDPPSSDSVCKHVVISDNVVSGYRLGVQSIFMHAGEDVIITGNHVFDALIGITANPYNGTDVVRNILIAGNLVVGTTDVPAGADTSGNCIGVGGGTTQVPTDVMIAGNTVVGCNKGLNNYQGGIGIGSSDRVTVRGNQVLDCFVVGIAINNPSNRVVVTDNTIENTQPSTGAAGIWVRTSSPGMTSGRIENNIINGNNQLASIGIRLDCPEPGPGDCGDPSCTLGYPALVIGKNDIINVTNGAHCGQWKATFDVPINGPGTASFPDPTCVGAPGTACVNVNFVQEAEPDAQYSVALTGNAAEMFWVTDKSANGFIIRSSNASSAASVDWHLIR